MFQAWKVDDVPAGYHKVVKNFELRTVNNAGHLVPMDQGAAARHMLNHFVKKTTTWMNEEFEEEKEKRVRYN